MIRVLCHANLTNVKQIIFDVETIKTFDQVGGYYPEKLGISYIGVIKRDGFPEDGEVKEQYYGFFENDIKNMWDMFEAADVVIGFNSEGFDLPAIQPYYHGNALEFPSLDLMARVKDSFGRRIGLDAIATQTLGTKKSGHGLDAIEYYKNKEFDKLAKYCQKDVEITRDLYDYGRKNGKVKFLNKWNNLMTVEVDFSFTPPPTIATQMSLI